MAALGYEDCGGQEGYNGTLLCHAIHDEMPGRGPPRRLRRPFAWILPSNHPVVPSLAAIASRSGYRIDRQTTTPMMPSTKARLRILRKPDMRRLQMSDDTLAGVQSSSA